MSFFPAFIKMDNMRVLVIGGGKIATEKVEKLVDFSSDITVIATEICHALQEICSKSKIKNFEKAYEYGDIDRYDIVIIAVDDISLQEEIYREAKEKKVLCNAVDSVDYCDFIFPSYIKEGDITIAVSTSGSSPAVAKYLRRYIQKLLPKNLTPFVKKMKELRKKLPKGKERMQFLDKKAKEFFDI